MVHNENLCNHAEMYALGGLNDEEKAAFEAHLAACEACALEVAELKAIVDLLPLSAEPVRVPAGMQQRILGAILGEAGSGQEAVQPAEEKAGRLVHDATAQAIGVPTRTAGMDAPATTNTPYSQETAKRTTEPKQSRPSDKPLPGRRGFSSWINLGLAAAVILLGIYVFTLKDQVADLRSELTATTKPPQGLRPSEAVNLSAAARDIVANGLATIVIDSKGTHLLVQAEKLPQLKGNEAFQVWLMKDGSGVVNVGTFVSRDGKGGLYLTLDRNLSGYNQIAITQEPDAFGQLPRGSAVLTAAISL